MVVFCSIIHVIKPKVCPILNSPIDNRDKWSKNKKNNKTGEYFPVYTWLNSNFQMLQYDCIKSCVYTILKYISKPHTFINTFYTSIPWSHLKELEDLCIFVKYHEPIKSKLFISDCIFSDSVVGMITQVFYLQVKESFVPNLQWTFCFLSMPPHKVHLVHLLHEFCPKGKKSIK